VGEHRFGESMIDSVPLLPVDVEHVQIPLRLEWGKGAYLA